LSQVSVARALYCGGSLLILDDILAALDAHVQRKMMTNLESERKKMKKLIIFGE
jgi:ABC-type dipeptide/oligopeptide/nickel transport system ATPase subunit